MSGNGPETESTHTLPLESVIDEQFDFIPHTKNLGLPNLEEHDAMAQNETGFADVNVEEVGAFGSGKIKLLTVHRGQVFQELMLYFKDRNIGNNVHVYTVEMISMKGDKELAEDDGGVCCDMLTEFWNDFLAKSTIGNSQKITFIKHDNGSRRPTISST